MTFMNHLVVLDAGAGELEKILSGVKCMLVKEIDTDQPALNSGDTLYFLRDNAECIVRVQATVLRVLPWKEGPDEDISSILKELQPKLQLTEGQYNFWSGKKGALFVEFEAARKIDELHIASEKIMQREAWIDFEEVHELTQQGEKNASGNKD
jgi:hypothetical protein